MSIRSRIARIYYSMWYKIALRKYNLLNTFETLEFLKKGKSLCRFGDGELRMALQYINKSTSGTKFQNYSPSLGKSLYNILLKGPDEYCEIGLPGPAFGLPINNFTPHATSYWQRFVVSTYNSIYRIIDPTKLYCDSLVSRCYIDYKQKDTCQQIFNSFIDLFENRNILLVEGQYTGIGTGMTRELLSKTKSIRRIICPAKNAYNSYDKIKEEILKVAKPNDLILCALGMTATVLAYELAHDPVIYKKNIQIIDLGHLDIEYSWFLLNATTRIPIPGKFTNEIVDGDKNLKITDDLYEGEILSKIEA